MKQSTENKKRRQYRKNTKLPRLLFLCVIVGIVAGLGAAAFFGLLEVVRFAFLDQLAGFHPPGPSGEGPLFLPSETPFNRWIFFLLPSVGGLLCGAIVYRFAPETAGHGTDAAIEAYHFHDGKSSCPSAFCQSHFSGHHPWHWRFGRQGGANRADWLWICLYAWYPSGFEQS